MSGLQRSNWQPKEIRRHVQSFPTGVGAILVSTDAGDGYLCSILDGYSRFVVHWEIRQQMTEKDVEIIVQRASPREVPGKVARPAR